MQIDWVPLNMYIVWVVWQSVLNTNCSYKLQLKSNFIVPCRTLQKGTIYSTDHKRAHFVHLMAALWAAA